MRVMRQGQDGQWVPATPLPPQGWVARLEFWLRARRRWRWAGLLARWDERGLG